MRRNIALLIFDEVEVLDFAGPFEVFAVADELHGHELFNVYTVGLLPGTVRARNGLKVVPDFVLEQCPSPHGLIVPGGAGTRALLQQPTLLEWIQRVSKRAEFTMSVCTGALVLAKAGLLDDLRVTTHHSCLDALAQMAPRATVDSSARFHDNGKVLTAAGISAGIDCALYTVRRTVGQDVARNTAEYMEYPLA